MTKLFNYRYADGEKQFDVKMLSQDQRLLPRKTRVRIPGEGKFYRSLNKRPWTLFQSQKFFIFIRNFLRFIGFLTSELIKILEFWQLIDVQGKIKQREGQKDHLAQHEKPVPATDCHEFLFCLQAEIAMNNYAASRIMKRSSIFDSLAIIFWRHKI